MTDESVKPRRRRKQERPAEILEAGLAEFLERGFEGARVEDIARRAGVAKGTVFRYFPSKEALFEAALEAQLQPVFALMAGVMEAPPGPPLALIEALITATHRGLLQGDVPRIIRMVISEGQRFPGLLEAYHRQSMQRGEALMHSLLARGLARGDFVESPVTALPMVLMAPALMAAVWHLTFDRFEPLDPERMLAAHLHMVRAVLTRPG